MITITIRITKLKKITITQTTIIILLRLLFRYVKSLNGFDLLKENPN